MLVIAIALIVVGIIIGNPSKVAEWQNKVDTERAWQLEKKHRIDVDKYLDEMEKKYARPSK